MKTRWESITGSALALAAAWPLLAAAQQSSSPSPGVTNAPTLAPSPSPAVPAAPPPAVPSLSPWSAEIAKLARAGISDQVIIAYIDGTEGTFNLSADQIIYLRTLGVSSQAIASMMRHDGEVNAGIRPLAASTVPASQPTLRLVFEPAAKAAAVESESVEDSTATAQATASASLASANESAAGDQWPDSAAENPPDWNIDYARFAEESAFAPPKQTGATELYPTRHPFVEEVTDPIIVFKGSARTPNVVIIEFSP